MASNPNEVLSKNQPARKGADEQREGREEPAGDQRPGPSKFRTLKGLIAGLAVAGALTGAAMSGCAEDNANPPEIPCEDGGCTDGGLDADTDSDADTSTDTGTDSETSTDTGTDSETSTDTGTDTDTTTDSGTDTDLDGGTEEDAGPVLCEEGLEAEPEVYTDPINVGEPVTIGGYVFEYLGASGIDAKYKISCGGATVEDMLLCQVGSTTTRVTAEGKTISIHPNAAGSEFAAGTVSVE